MANTIPPDQKVFPIISKYYWFYLLISLGCILPGIFFLSRFGLRQSIDFTGGTLLEIAVSPREPRSVTRDEMQKLIGDDVIIERLESTGENQFLLRMSIIDEARKAPFLSTLEKELGSIQEKRFETIGSIVGKELFVKTMFALGIGAAFITVYLATRFSSLSLGVCALLATLHDAIILVGSFSFFGYFFHVEVDPLFVTALLTILSFSVHDTIIVYDRVRERQRGSNLAFSAQLIDQSVLDTIVRSLRNSLAIILMLVTFLLLGGVTLRWFIMALLIGTITGTYSSTFTAMPLLLVWLKLKAKMQRKRGVLVSHAIIKT